MIRKTLAAITAAAATALALLLPTMAGTAHAATIQDTVTVSATVSPYGAVTTPDPVTPGAVLNLYGHGTLDTGYTVLAVIPEGNTSQLVFTTPLPAQLDNSIADFTWTL
jgi:hypothetical protein